MVLPFEGMKVDYCLRINCFMIGFHGSWLLISTDIIEHSRALTYKKRHFCCNTTYVMCPLSYPREKGLLYSFKEWLLWSPRKISVSTHHVGPWGFHMALSPPLTHSLTGCSAHLRGLPPFKFLSIYPKYTKKLQLFQWTSDFILLTARCHNKFLRHISREPVETRGQAELCLHRAQGACSP